LKEKLAFVIFGLKQISRMYCRYSVDYEKSWFGLDVIGVVFFGVCTVMALCDL